MRELSSNLIPAFLYLFSSHMEMVAIGVLLQKKSLTDFHLNVFVNGKQGCQQQLPAFLTAYLGRGIVFKIGLNCKNGF